MVSLDLAVVPVADRQFLSDVWNVKEAESRCSGLAEHVAVIEVTVQIDSGSSLCSGTEPVDIMLNRTCAVAIFVPRKFACANKGGGISVQSHSVDSSFGECVTLGFIAQTVCVIVSAVDRERSSQITNPDCSTDHVDSTT